MNLPAFLGLCYLVMSSVTFCLFGIDKTAAIHNRLRISEKHLLLWSIFGGWPGAWLGMKRFRHKTVKATFRSRYWKWVLMNFFLLYMVVSFCKFLEIETVDKHSLLVGLKLIPKPIDAIAEIGGVLSRDRVLIAAVGEDSTESTVAYIILCSESNRRSSVSIQELRNVRVQNSKWKYASGWPDSLKVTSKRQEILQKWGLSSRLGVVFVSHDGDLDLIKRWLYELRIQHCLSFPGSISNGQNTRKVSLIPQSYSFEVVP